jgi:DNA repair exonuclease SbcCD ATPase subunit
MTKEIDFSKFENPNIQVVWEDYNENFTQDRIKSVKHYFQKKYNTTNVNVITKAKVQKEDGEQTVDVSVNIMDTNYQVELLKQFLTSKNYDKHLNDILNHNKMVENKMQETETDSAVFKKWFIKNIEFSNFLSYGENQKVDFEKTGGLTVIESNPPNFGGKTVLSVDLLLFLFFNETTKTTKAEEIFNRFTDKDKVTVKGEIIIDGEEYIIVRNIERKLSKKGEWNVKTELDFFKKMADGTLQNFTGEQRRETEKFIKDSIGTKEDFLMTILTTATNLEELIDSKPTARGQVLSRFMGLDFLRRKEDAAKSIYSDFSKSMLSNIYNTEQLKTDNENNETKITELRGNLETYKDDLKTIEENIVKGKDYRDDMLRKKHTDIDAEISRLNPSQVRQEIENHEYQVEQTKTKLNELNVVEPKEYYKEDEHDKVKEEYNVAFKEKVQLDTKISEIEKLRSSVKDGIKCEHCGIDLMNASITQLKISELAGFITHKAHKEELMTVLTGKEKGFVDIKKQFDEYEKNKLIKEKHEATIENYQLKIGGLQTKLTEYDKMLDKIKANEHIDTMLIKANMRLEDLDRQKTQKQNQINNDEYSIKTLEEKIKTNLNNIIKIAEEQEKEKIYKIFLEAYGKNGISKIIMKTMIPLINSELQRLMEESAYFKLQIQINDKNEVEFNMIDNGTGIEKLMASGSGYERTIASLALRSVLSKICSLPKPNIVVMDEVFGKISNENLEMVHSFFVAIKDFFPTILLISHNPLITNWADNLINITKTDNISTVSQK